MSNSPHECVHVLDVLPMFVDYDDEVFPREGITGLQRAEFWASKGQHGGTSWGVGMVKAAER